MKNLSTIISWLKLNLKHVGYGQANHLPSRVKYKYFSIKLGPALGLLLPALVPLLPALEHVTFKKNLVRPPFLTRSQLGPFGSQRLENMAQSYRGDQIGRVHRTKILNITHRHPSLTLIVPRGFVPGTKKICICQ